MVLAFISFYFCTWQTQVPEPVTFYPIFPTDSKEFSRKPSNHLHNKMSETLNFGPEWLRALSSGSGGGVQQFKLAEHRYGREEMLALFNKTEKVPSELAEFQSILRKECQSPLTLSPLSEEERVSWLLGKNKYETKFLLKIDI